MLAAIAACLAGALPANTLRGTDTPATGDTVTPFALQVVNLPPYVVGAVTPPWARDARTAVTSSVLLAAAPAISLADALQEFAGVQITQPGGPGGRSSIYIRGGEENYALVLLDGVPVNNSTDSRGGGFDLGTLDAGEFAAATIVRGPISARYGPEALSGVIELTSDVLGPQSSSTAGAGAGSDGQVLGFLLARARQDASLLSASAHWSEDGSRQAGNFARHTAAATGVFWHSARLEWRMSVRQGRYENAAFPDDSGGQRLAVLRSLEERSGTRTTAQTELLSPGVGRTSVKWRVRAWGARLQAHDDSPGVAPGFRDPAGLPASHEVTILKRLGFAAEGAVDAGDHGTLAFGADGESEDGRSDAVLVYGPYLYPASFAATRRRVGAFSEYTWQPAGGWLVQPSVRLDRMGGYRPRLTPRLGSKFPLGPETALRLNAGTGFKRPSFYALSNPLVGNPTLRPERALTVDAAIERRLAGGRIALELGGFSSRYYDGIDFDPGPPPRLVNRNQIRSDGLEMSLRARLTGTLEVVVAAAYNDVHSEPGGGRLRGRPRAKGSIQVQWTPHNGLSVGSRVVAEGGVLDSSVPTGDVGLSRWCRMDLSGRYQLRPWLSLTAAIENLFAAHYEEAVGVPSPGMRWRADLEARF